MPRKKIEGVHKKQPGAKPKKSDKLTGREGDPSVPDTKASFPIIGIGASAGGLEAFEQFFTNIPLDTGMAFVLIQHLDPTHKSILTELVQRYTRMKVQEVVDGVAVEPNTVYIIPPNRYLAILHGKLHLMEPTAPPGQRTPIDFFFRSLAEDQKDKSICIVLSGTGTEGALGLRAIKGEGGMGMVQEPGSAKYDGMPRSAVATGLADYVTPVERMPGLLIEYVRRAFGRGELILARPLPKEASLLEKVFIVLRSHTGHDFSHYKPSTILRRIERRMAVNRIGEMSLYLRHLQDYPPEAQTLFKELLIGVTNFFRDPDAFEILRDKVIREILENRKPANPVRIWVAGCSTGEEAYSIAILLRECMDGLKREFSVQLFATDIDTGAIETARSGLYPKSIAADVPAEILTRHFQKEESSFRVRKNIRDMVVFAQQNVIADPPFSKTDLISCRNLLIYLGPEVQKKVLSLFHYSLKVGGTLFLGSSETIGDHAYLFATLDRKWKIYRRKDSGRTHGVMSKTDTTGIHPHIITAQDLGYPNNPKRGGYRDVVEKILLERYGQAGVLIDEKGEILYVHRRTGKYLEIRSGEFTGSIVGMARQGLKLELAAAIRDAVAKQEEVRHEKLRVKTNGEDQLINLIVSPVTETASLKGLFMVIFENVAEERKQGAKRKKSLVIQEEEHPRIRELEHELRSNKEYLQTTVEELETANEELKSTNEELQSSNEELQSTNEEL
ncbi:MAG: CheR family methyltransferase, partial [Pseudomonadota bacterium]